MTATAVKPVTGTVRWLRPLIVGKQLGRISITNASGYATEYDIAAFVNADGSIQGFGLAKDDDEIRSIDTTGRYGWSCDCPDMAYRNRECKHVKALREALKVAGIEVSSPRRSQPTPAAVSVELDDL